MGTEMRTGWQLYVLLCFATPCLTGYGTLSKISSSWSRQVAHMFPLNSFLLVRDNAYVYTNGISSRNPSTLFRLSLRRQREQSYLVRTLSSCLYNTSEYPRLQDIAGLMCKASDAPSDLGTAPYIYHVAPFPLPSTLVSVIVCSGGSLVSCWMLTCL